MTLIQYSKSDLRELTIYVDCVETRDEIDEDVVYTFGDLAQQSGGDLFVGRVLR